MNSYMIHIEEAPMGSGELDHRALIEISSSLEPWKTFSLEHINEQNLWQPAYDHIQSIANTTGHKWSPAIYTRNKFLSEKQGGSSKK